MEGNQNDVQDEQDEQNVRVAFYNRLTAILPEELRMCLLTFLVLLRRFNAFGEDIPATRHDELFEVIRQMQALGFPVSFLTPDDTAAFFLDLRAFTFAHFVCDLHYTLSFDAEDAAANNGEPPHDEQCGCFYHAQILAEIIGDSEIDIFNHIIIDANRFFSDIDLQVEARNRYQQSGEIITKAEIIRRYYDELLDQMTDPEPQQQLAIANFEDCYFLRELIREYNARLGFAPRNVLDFFA